jgi:hypothetical protein
MGGGGRLANIPSLTPKPHLQDQRPRPLDEHQYGQHFKLLKICEKLSCKNLKFICIVFIKFRFYLSEEVG